MTDTKIKLNMGAGVHIMPDAPWINIDKFDYGNGSTLLNVEQTPWPWETSSVDEMLWNHSMEHVGQDPQVFLAIMKEIYRVCCHGAILHIHVPHPRHDEFLGDPTHVRPITADLFVLFSKEANEHFRANGGANSCFALQLGVDFKLLANNLVLDSRFEYLKDDPSWERMALTQNNVVRELRLTLQVIKNA